MLLTHNDTLFYCEACEGYAVIRNENGKLSTTPCYCDFEKDN